MKGLPIKMSKGIQSQTMLQIIDNTGAKIARVIRFIGKGSTCRRYSKGSIGDIAVISVVKGVQSMLGLQYCIIVRQRGVLKRPMGVERFDSNAGVICTKDGADIKGSMIRSCIAREAAIRWPALAGVASKIR